MFMENYHQGESDHKTFMVKMISVRKIFSNAKRKIPRSTDALSPHLVCDERLCALNVLVSVSMDILVSLRSGRLLARHQDSAIVEDVL